MKSHKRNFFILGMLFGICLTVGAFGIYLNVPATSSNPKELKVDEAVSKIRYEKIKEAYFTASRINWIDVEGNRYFSYIGSDATREALLNEIKSVNEQNRNLIMVSEDPQSSGLIWLGIINALPFVILAVCLILAIYWVTKSKSDKIN